MAARDALFAVRNNFYLGAYQNVISEGSVVLSGAEEQERDAYVYRAYIAQGSYDLVISEIKDSAPMALQAVKLLAQHLGGRLSVAQLLSTLASYLSDPACNRNPIVLLMAGTSYAQLESYADALSACHLGLSLEMMALCVQVYLKMDRVDKAEQQLKAMAQVDDDATITQLATAWVNMHLGGAKIQEAQYIYQELGDRIGWTAYLYNGRAVSRMKQGDWEGAERDLLEAQSRDPKNVDTLANLITVGLHLGKSVTRYTTQLKLASPQHPYILRLDSGESLFTRSAAAMA